MKSSIDRSQYNGVAGLGFFGAIVIMVYGMFKCGEQMILPIIALMPSKDRITNYILFVIMLILFVLDLRFLIKLMELFIDYFGYLQNEFLIVTGVVLIIVSTLMDLILLIDRLIRKTFK